jgi:PTH1 family peptidyl-tRNA hydrolase
MRGNGSSGGHNGLRDIERALGTNQYPRLRVGIDAPRGQIPLRDFVLSSLSADQRKLIEPALDRAVDAALMWMEKGVEPVMNRFNAEDKEKEPET